MRNNIFKKDSLGRDILEGDIVQINNWPNGLGVVNFNKRVESYFFTFEGGEAPSSDFKESDILIVGNIIENKEMVDWK